MNILIVCTGNTCRSPMAEGLLRHMLQSMCGEEGFQVISAGTAALEGDPAAEHAVTVLAERGIDLSGHRSRSLSRDLIVQANRILAMTEQHRDAVLVLVPEAEENIQVLAMPDPFGMPVEVYRECAQELEKLLEAVVKELKKEEETEGRKKNNGEE